MPRKAKGKPKGKKVTLIQPDSGDSDTSSVILPTQRTPPANEAQLSPALQKTLPAHVSAPDTIAPPPAPTTTLPAASSLPYEHTIETSKNTSFSTASIHQYGTKRASKPSPDSSHDSEEEIEVPKNIKRRTKPQTFNDLTVEQEDELVEWIRERPIFYDQSMRELKGKHKKNRLWEMKAKEMGVDAIALMTWFRNKRTIYGKLKKTKSGQAAKTLTGQQRWTLEAFKFLDEHMTVRTTSSQLGAPPSQTISLLPPVQCEEDSDEDDVLQVITTKQQHSGNTTATVTPISDSHLPSTSAGSQTVRTIPKKTKKQKPSVDKAIVNMCTRLASRPVAATAALSALPEQSNRRVAYCHYLESEVAQMTEEQWLQFQRNCNELLYRLSVERLQQQQQLPVQQCLSALQQHSGIPASVSLFHSLPVTPPPPPLDSSRKYNNSLL
ncbi:uncharacterized protein LOC117530064 isoform X2 [Thalassophryne amazonica]|nr:uncharacterized protein LOC117530064 isoform X2 [Thalassophryne amazonica]